MTLRRLVLTFTREGVEIQALYRKRSQADPGPVVDAHPRAVAAHSDLAPSPRYKVGAKKGA
jgi:hypothetical protein